MDPGGLVRPSLLQSMVSHFKYNSSKFHVEGASERPPNVCMKRITFTILYG